MICQSIYDSLEAIPETLREEFEQKNGRWQLKDSAIPGVGSLFNQALVDNERKAVDQVKTRNVKIRELEAETNRLTDQISTYQQPGSVVLSKEDSLAWERYTKLGAVKDLETKLGEFSELKGKVGEMELTNQLAQVSKESGLNHEVLADWALSPSGQGLNFFTKEVTTKDQRGQDVVSKVPMVKIETQNGNKLEVTESELLPFAKEKMPEWKFKALTEASVGQPAPAPLKGPVGVVLPKMGKGAVSATGGTEEGQRPVDKFNAERGAKRNPFLPAPAK